MKKMKQNRMDQERMHQYDDIIHLPRPVSKTHLPMPIQDRAAQFAPFAALTGHHAAIQESARLTDAKIELDENTRAILDEQLRYIREMLPAEPEVSITYFVPDSKKPGGSYVTVNGCVKKIQEFWRTMILTDGTEIPMDEMIELFIL